MKFQDMDEVVVQLKLAHHFLPPIDIAKANLQLAKNNTENEMQKQRIEQALQALSRIENIVKNLIETGEIREDDH